MLIGYARTSTTDQTAGLEAQQRDLAAAGCEQVFNERVSSIAERTELERALAFVRKGDTLVVHAARSGYGRLSAGWRRRVWACEC